MRPPSLPPIPPNLTTPKVVRGPIQPEDPRAITTGRVGTAQLRRIGAVAVEWARLENMLNDLIWTINDKDLATGRFDTQDLDITKLLSALQKSISTNLPGPSLSNERKAITNLIDFVNNNKSERNAVIHGSWAEREGVPIVGSLRFEKTSNDFVTFEVYNADRMMNIEKAAIDARKAAHALILRIESLRGKPAQTDGSNRPLDRR
jgi:hypothetical protein